MRSLTKHRIKLIFTKMRKIIQLMTNRVKTVTLFLATLVVVSLTTSCKKEDSGETLLPPPTPEQQTPLIPFTPPRVTISNSVKWYTSLDESQGYLIIQIKIPSKKGNNDLKNYLIEDQRDIQLKGQWSLIGERSENMIEKVIDLSTNDRSFDLFQKEGEKNEGESPFLYLEYKYKLSNIEKSYKWKLKDAWIDGSIKYETYDNLKFNTYPRRSVEIRK